MDDGYPSGNVALAAVGTLIFPFISLVGAILLLSGQTDTRKREQLRTWAWASGIWLVVATTLAVLLAFV